VTLLGLVPASLHLVGVAPVSARAFNLVGDGLRDAADPYAR